MRQLQIIFALFILSFLLIIGKLFYIQIFAADDFKKNMYLTTQRIELPRGVIYDRNDEPLVLNETKYRLFAEPKYIKNKKKAVESLDSILQLGQATLEAKINSTKLWVSIISGLTEDQKSTIQKLKIKGLGFENEDVRYYPEGSSSAHLLGFVGKNSRGDNIGYFGVEGFYEKDLRGLPGLVKSERDVLGKPILIGVQDVVRGESGRGLTLTIDKTAQMISKTTLLTGLNKYGAESGCIIVANPQTLEILALSCLPDFDPNTYYEFSEEFFMNPAISTSFEPGSIFKPFIMAAALEEETVEPTDIYDEAGPVSVGGYIIKNWNDKYAGEITMSNIIEKSSNVGMVYVGSTLKDKKILEYLDKYGFGKKTMIDLQGEVDGLVKAREDWYKIDYSTITFGQGIGTTPIQIIRAFSALVNGGVIMKPHIVKKIASEDGEEKIIHPKQKRRVISKKTSIIIKRMLQKAVEHGEVKWKVPKGYKIGGKTGTAQIPIEGHYDPSKTVASYIGFAPVNDPKLIALVILREPTASPWGSETAAPLFFDLARELLVYYNIAPD